MDVWVNSWRDCVGEILDRLPPHVGSYEKFLKNWAIHGLFFFIFVFSTQLIVNNIAADWIRTLDL